MQKEIKKIRKQFKSLNKYKDYKKIFKNKKMRFLVSKIFLVFSDFNIKQIVNFEQKLMKDISENCFVKIFNKIKMQGDWKAFGKFIYLIYQTANYKYDKKNKKYNIFIENPLLGNEKKRIYYNQWLNSLNFAKLKTNLKVRKLLKLVF